MVANDLAYILYWEDDVIPIEGSITLGNHLENDIIVPGEDVADYHIRIESTDRGPVVVPLVNATVNVNGRECNAPVQIIIGDVISIGQATMQVGMELERQPLPEERVMGWSLHSSASSESFEISGEVAIGRADDAQISLDDEHISRYHARFVERQKVVWVQDLQSANGTVVNGDPIVGGVRLFHGDFVRFDKLEFQLIASGADLTPIQDYKLPLKGTDQKIPEARLETHIETTQFVAVDEAEVQHTLADVELTEAGAFLLGASDPVDGLVFRMGVGESLLGRGANCEIRINDPTVSSAHAQINLRPEGITLTNLMSTNGTRVNGEEIISVQLADGDVVRLGRVGLVFKDIPSGDIEQHPFYARLNTVVLASTLLAAALLLFILF